MPRTTDTLCGDCGAPLEEYDVYKPSTKEKVGSHTVCPNQWKAGHP